MEEKLKSLSKNKILIGCICIILVEIIYGISYMFTRKATQSGASSLALLGWRFVVAFLVILILVICRVIKLDFKGKAIKYALLTALFSPILYFVGETFGVANTSSSESGVMLAMIPVPAIIASTIILKKKPSLLQVIGIVITFGGVITTVAFAAGKPSFSVKGYLFLLLAIVSYVMYSIFVEKANQFTCGELTFCMVASGALVFSISALIESGVKHNTLELLQLPFKNKDFLIAMLYQGICCSAIAFFLQNAGISRIGVNGSSCFIGVSTVVSILAGVLVLNEKFEWYQIVGTILIIAGVITANIKTNKVNHKEKK